MIKGYNNSRIMDQLTDQKGDIIKENLDAVVSLSGTKVQAMRFPGGTLARDYNITLAGYDGGGKLYGGKNVIDSYIDLIKRMDVPVTLVLNVGFYDTFYWKIITSRAAEMRDNNRRMIDRFLKNGIKVFCVEVGNEEYIHVPKGQVLSPSISYSFIQRLLGQPSRDAKFRDEILGYYRMYADLYYKNSEIASEFGLDSAVPLTNATNYKWDQWNLIMKDVPGKYGVWHHYESGYRDGWRTTIDNYISAIKEQNRIPICTEWSTNFGDQGNQNLNLSNSGFKEEYEKWLPKYLEGSKEVPLIMKHRISGDPKKWDPSSGGVPYDWM